MARTTYDDTITRFNSCNLHQSLELVSLLSAVEFEGGFYSPISSVLNSEHVRLLAEALIKSKAAWYKEQAIEPRDLPVLLNGTNEALEDKRLQQEVVSGGERQEMLYKLQRYLSRLAYIQIRPQQTPFIALGRILAILEVIPDKNLNELPLQLQTKASVFPIQVREILGLSVGDIAKVHLSIMDYFGRLGLSLLQRLPTPKIGQPFTVSQQADILRHLVATSAKHLPFFRLTPDIINKIAGEHIGNTLSSYAAIFGRPIYIHRELLERKEFKVGPEGHRLSPLDRFPLIADKEGGAWYAPNVRGLARSAPEVLHFALNENFREPYESVRGALLEVYLRLMLKSRAPELVVIQEKRWPSSKGGVDGPDLLIIDHSDDPAIIAVELKSRRMVLGTRYELLDEHMTQNYADLWKALKMLPGKIRQIFSLAGDYSNHEEDLNRARDYPVYYVGVAGEAPYLFGELTEFRRLRDPEFPLYGLDERFCVMSVDVFERMLEASIQGKRSVAEILREYLEDCGDIELSSPMAENFRHVELKEEDSFGFSFLKPFWPGA